MHIREKIVVEQRRLGRFRRCSTAPCAAAALGGDCEFFVSGRVWVHLPTCASVPLPASPGTRRTPLHSMGGGLTAQGQVDAPSACRRFNTLETGMSSIIVQKYTFFGKGPAGYPRPTARMIRGITMKNTAKAPSPMNCAWAWPIAITRVTSPTAPMMRTAGSGRACPR